MKKLLKILGIIFAVFLVYCFIAYDEDPESSSVPKASQNEAKIQLDSIEKVRGKLQQVTTPNPTLKVEETKEEQKIEEKFTEKDALEKLTRLSDYNRSGVSLYPQRKDYFGGL